MQLTRRSLLMLACGGALTPISCSIAQSRQRRASTQAPNFTVYDALYYAKRPQLNLPAVMVNGGEFWKDARRIEPDEAACRKVATYAAKNYKKFVIDIEHWAVDTRRAPTSEVQKSIQKIMKIVDWMKAEQPNLSIGTYGYPPLTDYWTPVANPLGMKGWQTANDFLRPIASRVDFLAPELYTYYDDQKGWLKFAEANLDEAMRFGKPVIPVLWPRYHVSNDKLKYQLVPGEFWRLQLKTVRESGVPGLILWDWGGDTPDNTLNPNWEWWTETVQFVRTLKQS